MEGYNRLDQRDPRVEAVGPKCSLKMFCGKQTQKSSMYCRCWLTKKVITLIWYLETRKSPTNCKWWLKESPHFDLLPANPKFFPDSIVPVAFISSRPNLLFSISNLRAAQKFNAGRGLDHTGLGNTNKKSGYDTQSLQNYPLIITRS